jgi:muramidase (phage lysozyme)
MASAVTRDDLILALSHPNVGAFLMMIRAGETGLEDDAYSEVYGGGHFAAPPWLHPHQAVAKAGLTSTAAGAYQFIAKTWDALALKYGFADFSPPHQDLAAIALIGERGALEDVKAGRLMAAIKKCAIVWASLPTSTYGQPTQSFKHALAVYQQQGGTVSDAIPQPQAPIPQPLPTTPQPEGSHMIPIPLLLAGLDFLKGVFPAVAGALNGNQSVPERNVEIANTLLDAATRATQSSNFQEAIQKIQSDPVAKAAAQQAVHAELPALMEAGGGGIKGARDTFIGSAPNNDLPWWKSFTNIPFAVILMMMPIIYFTIYTVLTASGWSDEVRASVVSAVVSGVLFGVMGFALGTSYGSQKKDGLIAGLVQ